MKRVSFKTLGCRLNQYETDALVTEFHNSGYEVVKFSEPADITIVNTCTVTNQSDQKSRNMINHTASKNSNALVVVTGCMANNYKNELESQENISYVVDNARKSQIVSLVESHLNGEIVDPENLTKDIFGFEAVDRSLHTRTSIKIQDGCDNFCTFCIIPSVRGRAVSRPVPDILDNVKRVLDHGFREIVITGVNIGRYDHDGVNFEQILERILEIEGDFRVRISSIEPDGFGNDFYKLFQHPKLTPHLHLCLQSGSEQLLLKMRRMYSARSFMDTVSRFRTHYPDFNFSTDIIVGFPGESDVDFQDTCTVAEEAGFSHIHTFRYSRRKGTRADRMTDQVPEKIKSERSEIIREISEHSRMKYLNSMLNKKEKVLIEKVDNRNFAYGYGEHFIPVKFKTDNPEKNIFKSVNLDSITGKPDALSMIGSIRKY